MRTPIMVHENRPCVPPWLLQWEASVEEAKAKAWKLARDRDRHDPKSPVRFHVQGMAY